MAVPTPANFGAFVTTVETMIGAVYEDTVAKTTQRYVSDLPAGKSSQVTLGWTGMMPKARVWYGPRVAYEPAIQSYTVVPIPYELTYTIDRFTVDDDQYGVLYRTLPDMGRQWGRQREYETRDLLENAGVFSGARQNGFDGLTHWNTAHPIDIYNPNINPGGLFSGGTYCNDFIGGQTINGTLIGGALSTTSFASLLQYMSMLPAEDGEVLGIEPDVMLIPATLRVEAQFILKATMLASPTWGAFSPLTGQVGAADNMLSRFGVEPVVNRFLRKTQRWYLLDTTKAFKPFLWVTREAPRTVPRVSESDPFVFDNHRFLWGGWDRVCPAWNFAFLSARSGPNGA